MLWDCPSCDTKKLLGLDHRHCPNCGAAQDPTKRYFPPESEAISADQHPYHGADKKCPACETPNAAIAHNCVNCGSALEGASTVALRDAQVAGAGGFAEDNTARAKEELRARKLAAEAPAKTQPKGAGKKIIIAVVLAVVMLFGSCVLLLLWKEPAELTVAGHSWVRTIQIEEYRALSESAWRGSVPSDAYGLSCSRQQRSTRQVADGEDCKNVRRDNGNGTFSTSRQCTTRYRSEPVYDDKCSYHVDRWVEVREARAEGGLADEPRWPSAQLSRTGTCRGCEREGARKEVYEVSLKDAKSGAVDRCAFDRPRWAAMGDGSAWKSERGVVTKSLSCDALQPR